MKKIEIETYVLGGLGTNCYFVYNEENREVIIFDPADDADFIATKINHKQLTLVAIIATHGHFDHNLAAGELQKTFDVPYFIHPSDTFLLKRLGETATHFLGYQVITLEPKVDSLLTEKAKTLLKKFDLQLLEMPGHTPGSIGLYAKKNHLVLTGDTLFADGGVGRTDFSYSSSVDLGLSLKKLLTLPDDTVVYPGHGKSTTIKEAEQFLQT